MSENTGATGELDRLLGTLETLAQPSQADPNGQKATRQNDAIDAVLLSPARTTAVRSLRHAPETEAFRQALVDGLIRVDTANELLRLVNDIVSRLIV